MSAPLQISPMSSAQQRFWLVDQIDGASSVYNLGVALRLRGRLDVDALRDAFALLVRRHESLRTVFVTVNGELVQMVLPRRPFPLPITDLTGSDPLIRAQQVLEEPYDLAKGPLLRAELIRIGPDDHVLVTVYHHIVMDRWSLGVLMHELSVSYGAAVEGRPNPLAAVSLQYCDYAAWQRAMMDGPEGAAAAAYWVETLRDAPVAVELPGHLPRPAVRSLAGGMMPVEIPAAMAAVVDQASRAAGVTPFMTMLAAMYVLINRYTGMDDLVIGTGPATRPAGTEAMVGALVNMLPLRTSLAGDPTFAELLERVRTSALGAFEHQSIPFDRIVELVAPERDADRMPLVQVGLIVQNAPTVAPELTGLNVEPLPLRSSSVHLDAEFMLRAEGDAYVGTFEYSTDIFSSELAADFAAQWLRILSAGVRAPRTPLTMLPTLADEEIVRALVDWNDTAVPLSGDMCLHRYVEAMAVRTPDALAVIDESEELTYAEVDARSGRLARHLRARGIGPEAVVGVRMLPGAGLLTTALAVLKAGGVYLPLDPSLPPERAAFMVSDAAATLVLDEDLVAEMTATAVPEVEFSDITPANLAYVVYTSGSTGTPKGVMTPHRGIVNTILGQHRRHGHDHRTKQLALLPIGFDPSIFDLFGMLTAGGTVVFPDPVRSRDARHWAELVERHRITMWHQGPAATEALLMAAGQLGVDLSSLTVVCIGGETMPTALPGQLRRAVPGVRVVNHGGPSEAAYCSNEFVIPDPGGEPYDRVPYGGAVPNMQLLVMDPAFAVAPPGVPGELCIAGVGLGRGYAGRPSLTADRYVPHPYAGLIPGVPSGARLYRSGDVAKWGPDGVIDLIGRKDAQIKIRGFRIEPGEVESVLRRHPAVREAAVTVEGTGITRRLMAFVVLDPAVPAPVSLTDHVARFLPAYMVPVAIVPIDAMPRTPNQKVDLPALARMALVMTTVDRPMPEGELETEIAAVWRDLLGIDGIGATDGFFAVGGHSLMATRLALAFRSHFGVDVPIRDLFSADTIRAQAEYVRAAGTASVPGQEIVAGDPSEPAPLSYVQERMWFFDQLAPGSPAYHVPAAVRLDGPLDADRLAACLRAIIERHDVLRSVVVEQGGEMRQLVQPVPERPFDVVDLSGLPGSERDERLAVIASDLALRPFDLSSENPVRAGLVRTGPAEHHLYVTAHHLAADGWSMALVLRELMASYANPDAALPALPYRYADYARWQREAGQDIDAQIDYWRERLAGPLPVLDLPADRPRPSIPTLRGGVRRFTVSAALTDRLRRLAAGHGATLYMVLLGAFQVLQGRLCGSDDVIVGTPVAGRTRAEFAGVVGCFVNTLALRTDLSGDPRFGDLLDTIQDRTLADFGRQDVPFDRVVEAVGAVRDASRTPVFQSMLTLQNNDQPELEFDGVSMTEIGQETGTSLFDVMFTAVESGGGLDMMIEYATDLFDAETVDDLAERYRAVLSAVASDEDVRIGAIDLLATDERDRTGDRWNGAAVARTGEPVHRLIERRAWLHPDEVALIGRDASVTYGELNARADELAARLVDRGCGPESIVAVRMDATPDLVVAFLAVLKAGAAVTLIDPTQPEPRIAHVLAAASTVLTSADVPNRGDRAVPDRPFHGDGAACVFFTSGTTGRPKGSVFTHRALANFAEAMADVFALRPGDRFLQLASVGFDVFLEEVLPPLVAGAAVVLPGAGLLAAGVDLSELIDRYAVTGLELTTAYWHEWVADLTARGARPPAFLRLLAMGGERVQPHRLAQWCAFGVELVHVYGLTEVACTSTVYPLRADDDVPDRLPIGRPIANTAVRVLDPRLRPVPIGVPGEFYLAGVGPARGYLGQPGLTASRFVPDPFATTPGARMYRTGDLVADRRDGAIDFLGRVDHQVKLRGFRIEPAEVCAALTAVPQVVDAAVVVDGDALLAYVAAPADVDRQMLRAGLAERLPSYMWPSAIVVLDRLPLNANGKLDRAALPKPSREDRVDDADYVPPRTPVETALVNICRELLGIDRVGVHDDLLQLGIHSLMAVKVAARVRTTFAVDLTLRTLLEAPTIAELAVRVAAAQAAATDVDELAALLAEIEAR